MRKPLVVNLLACSIAVFFQACSGNLPTSVRDVSSGETPTARFAYPGYCFALNVPFLPQVAPGDWGGTKNCGQACGVMLGGYFNNGIVVSQITTDENTWLVSTKNDNRYRDPNGWYTSTSDLQNLLWGFHRLNSRVYYGKTPDDVVNEVANGRPTIVGVMIKGGRFVSSGGISHWALCVGWNGNIVLNDPGTSSGKSIQYSVAAFDASWATSGRAYIPVWK